jgi:hypothetical protein
MEARSLFAVLVLVVASPAFAVTVANPSFESPVVPAGGFPALPFVDNWTQEGAFQTTGVFPNSAPGSPDHISNMTGSQAAFISASPGVGLSQILSDTYAVGSSYDMTVGVAISFMFPPYTNPAIDQLQLSFFYMNGATPVTLGTPTLLGASGLSPNAFADFTASLPVVTAGDAWANQPIGIAIRSIHPTADAPIGYWDVDNVRVTATAVPEPASLGVLMLGGAALLRRRRRA